MIKNTVNIQKKGVISMTDNKFVLSWVEEMKNLVKPANVVWIDGSEEQLDALREQSCKSGEIIRLDQEKLPGCKITRWNRFAVDINAAFGSKVYGMQQYMKAHGIKQSEVMAFGDGENDMDMLSFAQIGVAMGNADKLVKECADYVTSSVDDDGIQKALLKFEIL